MDESSLEVAAAQVGEVRLTWREVGRGPLVLLLHGFPEFWYAWREQFEVLSAAGYRVVAPDLRGYGESEKPASSKHYTLDQLAADIAQLIEVLGEKQAIVIGHDWGAVITWRLARMTPERLRGFVAISVAHPRAIFEAMRSPSQLFRFWYQYAMQPPLLPELFLRMGNYKLLRYVIQRGAKRREAIGEQELRRYVDAWSAKGALRAMANYYRALYRRKSKRKSPSSTEQPPALLIVGERDPVFRPDVATRSKAFVPQLDVQIIERGGHFLPWDAPEQINPLLLSFLKRVEQAESNRSE